MNHKIDIKSGKRPLASAMCCVLSHSSRTRPSVTPWTVAHQVPLSMGFSKQEYWSGLPFPPGSQTGTFSSCFSAIARAVLWAAHCFTAFSAWREMQTWKMKLINQVWERFPTNGECNRELKGIMWLSLFFLLRA